MLPYRLRESIEETMRESSEAVKVRRILMEREPSTDIAMAGLLAIGMVDSAREILDQRMDRWHTQTPPVQDVSATAPEVIIGGGLHAAVYASARVAMGYGKPLVLEAGKRPGGVFAMTEKPSFFTNSRNRPGPLSKPGSGGALNAIPGSILQPAMLSGTEYQRNTDIAFCIKVALLMNSYVYCNCKVSSYTEDGAIYFADSDKRVMASRIIDARGLGTERLPYPVTDACVSFTEFMRRFEQPFPLRGMRRIAVIGGGDSAKVAIEAIFGQGPAAHYSTAHMDSVEAVDWYADLPTSCDGFLASQRTRYHRIGGLLATTTASRARLRVLSRDVLRVNGAFEGAQVNGTTYDMVVQCCGWTRTDIGPRLSQFKAAQGVWVARTQGGLSAGARAYSVGPQARLNFTEDELENEPYTQNDDNAVAIWRLAPRTALLAKTLK